MPTLSSAQKTERALKLLLGLGQHSVAQIMARHGFCETERLEGWQRLQSLAAARAARRATPKPGSRLIERLDAWESVWFPVADAGLREPFPEVHRWLFRDLAQGARPDVVGSVSCFVQRTLRMPSEPSLGRQGAAARELLAEHGIDAHTVRIASELLELLSSTSRLGPAEHDHSAEAAAEAALWSWYRVWSRIARAAISDRALLGELGLARPRPDASDAKDESGTSSSEAGL